MNLSNIITVNERFESSINLKLDLENNKKVDAYIPTSSSVAILDAFLEDLLYEKKWTSTMSFIFIEQTCCHKKERTFFVEKECEKLTKKGGKH